MVVPVLVLIVAIAVPFAVILCAAGVVPRGAWLGIRTAATMASDEAWQAGHRAAILPVSGGGVLSVLMAMALFGDDALSGLALLPMALGVVGGAVLASRAARRETPTGRH